MELTFDGRFREVSGYPEDFVDHDRRGAVKTAFRNEVNEIILSRSTPRNSD
jgi:hypothetical protein